MVTQYLDLENQKQQEATKVVTNTYAARSEAFGCMLQEDSDQPLHTQSDKSLLGTLGWPMIHGFYQQTVKIDQTEQMFVQRYVFYTLWLCSSLSLLTYDISSADYHAKL